MELHIPKFDTKVFESDYEKEGLIYCGKCNTPKQCIITLFGESRIMPCLCKCSKEQIDIKEAKRKENVKKQSVLMQRKLTFPDSRMENWTFENDDGANPSLTKKAKNYVKFFKDFYDKGRGILLYGNIGSGKTFIACCIANGLIDEGFSVIVKNFNSIANQLFSTSKKDEYMENLTNCALLILDDIDVERDTSYMDEIVFGVIDSRYRAQKPIIVTTNLNPAQMKNTSNKERKRVYSRLMEMCTPILVEGNDRRLNISKNLYKKDLEVLEK